MMDSALWRLRIGIAAIVVLCLVTLAYALWVTQNMERRYAVISEEAVPLLIELDELSQTAFLAIPTATGIIADVHAPDTDKKIATLVAQIRTLDTMLKEIEMRSSAHLDVTASHAARDDLVTATSNLENVAAARAQASLTSRDDLHDQLGAIKALQEDMARERNRLLTTVPSETQPLVDARYVLRLSKAQAELDDMETNILGMLDASSLRIFDQELALLKIHFRDYFLTIARMAPSPVRTKFAVDANAVASAFIDGDAGRASRQEIANSDRIFTVTREILDALARLKDETSGFVDAQRARVDNVSEAARTASRRSLVVIFLTALIAIANAGLIIYFVIERQIVYRLNKVRAQAVRINNGELDLPLVLAGKDEIALLSRSLEELRKFSVAQVNLQANLLRATIDAERAAKLKTEFLAMMSHEVRTPLNAIMGIFELIENANIPERQRNRARHGRLASEELFKMLSNVLDASRIEAEKLELAGIKFHLPTFIEEIGVATAGAIQKSKHQITYVLAIDDDLPDTMVTDRGRLRQVLVNLVDNAVRFTDNGTVTISAATHGDGPQARITFEVADTGLGIDPTAHDRIFEKFQQIDGSLTREVGGSGMGLAISRQLVRLMGGDLTVDSEIGKGATFRIDIPQHNQNLQMRTAA